jgi:hypothetical protein
MAGANGARARARPLCAPPPLPALEQLLCAIPSPALQWAAAIVGAALSALFVFKSLYPVVVESGAVLALRTVVPLVVLLQLAFAVVLKLFFFSSTPA